MTIFLFSSNAHPEKQQTERASKETDRVSKNVMDFLTVNQSSDAAAHQDLPVSSVVVVVVQIVICQNNRMGETAIPQTWHMWSLPKRKQRRRKKDGEVYCLPAQIIII